MCVCLSVFVLTLRTEEIDFFKVGGAPKPHPPCNHHGQTRVKGVYNPSEGIQEPQLAA